MAEQPALNRFYVASYAANDRDFPIVAVRLDPRVAGYRVPEDLSPHPDSKRYPNHVFTGSQPSNGDERVTHIYEIFPSPWVPFTRYDDDLGPIQGRRRSVKNEGQVASLAADKRTTYEAREGSAIVYTEIEETWSIAVDEDGNSLFPARDRDFYDASRGPVQERRQLFVPTGEEEGSLENINGVITQTSYEPYNEFLSVKIVQTYSVSGPQLVGKATNNEGQLVTVTTQRKAALDYIPPSPTATKTVEALREDAESLVERIVDTPRVFSAKTFSVERIDLTPEKFRFGLKTLSEQQTLEGIASSPELVDSETTNALSASEQQVTEFVKTISQTSREIGNARSLTSTRFVSELGGGYAVLEETYPAPPLLSGERPDLGTLEDSVENLGNGKNLRRKLKINPKNEQDAEFFTDDGEIWPPIGTNDTSLPILKGQDYDEELDIVIPYKQVFADPKNTVLSEGERRRITPRDVAHNLVVKYDIEDTQQKLDDYYWEIPDMINVQLPDKLLSVTLHVDSSIAESQSQGAGDTYTLSVSERNSVGGTLSYQIEQGFNGLVPTIRSIFFLPKDGASPQDVLNRVNSKKGGSVSFWPNARPNGYQIAILEKSNSSETSESVSFDSVATSQSSGGEVRTQIASIPSTIHGTINISGGITSSAGSVSVRPSTVGPTNFSTFPTGLYLYQINATPYKFSYVRVDALLVQITSDYV